MNTKILSLFSLLLALGTARAAVTAFVYQGRLDDGGTPANGSYDLIFHLFDAATNGNAVANAITNPAVAVSGGTFSVQLDFGASVFDGSARWLEIGVRTNGSASAFTILSPRQAVTPTPYGIYAYSAGTAAVVPAANISGAVSFSQLPSVLLTNGQSSVVLNGTFVGNGGGLTNIGVGGTLNWQLVSGTSVQAAAQNGYIAIDSSPVTVTLPASPSIGDVIRVSGAGAGGWKVAQNPGQTILISSNISGAFTNFHWLVDTNIPLTRFAEYLASSADGSHLVGASTNGHLYTSSDYGVTWTERATNLSNPFWHGVASSADGKKLVAIVYGGQIYTSGDAGVTWTPKSTAKNWSAVASSADGTKLIAVAYNDFVYQSTNSGVDWAMNTSPWLAPAYHWHSAASSGDGSRLFVSDTDGNISYSTNGGATFGNAFLTSFNGVGVPNLLACSADGSTVFAAAQGGVYASYHYSGDFTSWTNLNAGPFASGSARAIACSADGSRVVIAAFYQIYYSFNAGATWYTDGAEDFFAPLLNGANSQAYWTAVALSADGTKAAISYDFFNSGRILAGWDFATRPGTAGYLAGPQYGAVELLYVGGGNFLPISYVGTLTPH